MPLKMDTQFSLLCEQIRRTDPSNILMRDEIVAYVKTFGHEASPSSLTEVFNALQEKWNISPVDIGSKPPEVWVEPTGLINPVFPRTGWFGEYMDYTLRHEAPDLFHFWVGASVLCAAVRRNVFFEQAYYRVYPNLYIILVAPPGACKKSTATNIGVEILQGVPDVNIIREKITPEGLIATIHETVKMQTKSGIKLEPTATAFIHAPELAVFLGRQTYNEGIIALLTTLYDCHNKWEYVTRGQGKLALHNLHITMLGATTPDLMANTIPAAAFGGGFLSRVIFVVKESSPRCEPFPTIRDKITRERLIARLQSISEREGQVVQNQEAMEWCSEWYKGNRKSASDVDVSLSGYYERKQDHLIKLSTLILLSEGADLVITKPIYQRALGILEHTEMNMSEAFTRVQVSQVGQDHERILRQLERGGGRMKHSDLLKKNYSYLDAASFKRAVGTLREAGMISEDVKGRATEYILLQKKGGR